jgi:uncharacterized protein with von Willebrand factor type A (vWA) domain
MKVFRYAGWDGTQSPFSLDADQALDALSDLMMHGLNVREALDHARSAGFELAGRDFRVMGTQELMRELARAARTIFDEYAMDHALDAMRERFEALKRKEQETLKESAGYESRAMNDFLERAHAPSRGLAESIERFADYPFQDDDARDAYQELKSELERLKALEQFLERHGKNFRGRTPADYDTAQRIREQIESMEQTARAMRDGKFENIDPGALKDVLGEAASQSLMIIRDLESTLRDRGYLATRDGRDELTPKAVRRIGAQALASVYGVLRRGRAGKHDTTSAGVATPRPDQSRPYQFGDALELDVVKSVLNGLRRGATGASGARGARLRLTVGDLEVREMDFSTQTTTVLLLDLSWSMSFEGRFPAAKRVALAMDQLIRTQFPRDHFFIVGFSTRARQLEVRELPEVTWDPGDPFTNLQEGLMVAERLILKHPSPSPQILVISDGQPTAYFTDGELHVEWPSGYGGVSPRAVAATLQQVKRVTQRGITINTFMLHDSPELVGFVERMTEINHGRALFTDPTHLGSYVMVDHLARRRGRAR